ncbi:MAG: PQ-loop domain-containing transporter [Xanthobacteraceae bacterium]|jgi:hypothetical protein
MTFSVNFTTVVGLLAAFCTTVSYIPQLKKCWDTGSADDLSLKIALWIVYGHHAGRCGDRPRQQRQLSVLDGYSLFQAPRQLPPAGLGAMSLAS